MKSLFTLVVLSLAILKLTPAPGQLKDQCSTCFESEIINKTKVDAQCTDYEIKVSYSGHCDHALSHFTVALPTCYTLSNLSNSENYAQEIGYDPTTGLTGFKIDNTTNFGASSQQSFLVSFTLCANSSNCSTPCWKPTVAYKAGNCFELDSLQASCATLKAHLETKNASCFGSLDGQVTAVIDDGTSPFQYLWSNGSTNSSLQNIGAGVYSVVVKDATGAQVSLSSAVSQPDSIVITPSITSATCSGQSNGAISITVSGGNGAPYTYSWSNGSTSKDLDSLMAGSYSVTIKDSLGCAFTSTFVVSNQKQLMLSASAQLPGCNQTNGSLSVTASGGTEPYSFVWSNGATSSSVSNLGAGIYSVTATDAEGCSVRASYSLHENNTLRINYSVTPTTCLDNGSGAINITVSGGTAPYSYTWSNGATTEDLDSLSSGSYTVIVKDSLGCQTSARILVFKNTFQVGSQITQPLCWGDSTGVISLSPSGGISPYQFVWTNGATSSSLTDLSAGNYTVTITDSTGCAKLLTYSIISPSQLQAGDLINSITCDSFSIDLSATGGTAPYQFLWSTGAQTEDISGITSGTYSVTITDAHGCSLDKQIKIDSVATWTCTITPPTTSPVCLSSSNKIFTSIVDASSYQWQMASADSSWQIQSGATADTLVYIAGNQNTSATVSLTITKNGCTQTCSYVISACSSSTGTGGGNNESCADCFTSTISKTSDNGSCVSYVVNFSTDGNCRYDLSHVVIAIPCGQLSDYSDSGNWPLVIGKDPTTGLVGLKVDNVNGFGKTVSSFTLRFTVCYDSDCGQLLKNWNPVVAYKAGQCIAYDTLSMSALSLASVPYPNPFSQTFSIDVSSEEDDIVTIELYDPYGRQACEPQTFSVSAGDKKSIKIDASTLPQNIYLYKVHTNTNESKGRIVKIN